MKALRQYQGRLHDGTLDAFKTHAATLLVSATGTGKTVTAAHIIRSMQPCRTLWLAHRDELLAQAKEHIEAEAGLAVELEKAELYASNTLWHRDPVVVSSIQTQISGPKEKRRYRRFKPEDFNLLVVDEAHHTTSASYKEVIAYYRQNPALRLLGLTATPKRADSEALSQIFESVAGTYEILDAIRDGYLVDIVQQFASVNSLDFSHIKTTAGDLNQGELSREMEREENIQGVCQPTIEAIYGLEPRTLNQFPVTEWRERLAALNKTPRQTLVFTVSVDQARLCAQIFSRVMPGVDWICGKTPADQRLVLLNKFKRNELHVLANVGIFTEGTDLPNVELLSVARPTKSTLLYTQIIGRALRPLPGLVDGIESAGARRALIAASAKPYARILDFCGNSGRHKLISLVDILGGHVSEEAADDAKEKAMTEGKPVRILVTMTKAEAEIRKKEREERDAREHYEAERRKHIVFNVDYGLEDVSPFANGDGPDLPLKRMCRDGRELSVAQANILRKRGYDPIKFGYRQAQAIIGKILSTPSEGQLKVLRKVGYKPEELRISMKEASALIDRVKANGWHRVSEREQLQPT